MENHIEDSKQDEHGLNNLPEGQKKETEEILAEINKETEGDKKPEGDKKDLEGQKPEDGKKEGDKKPDDTTKEGEKTGDEDKDKKPPRRDSKLVPSYLLGIEKTEREKERKELLGQIEALKSGAKSEDGEKKETTKVEIKALVDKIVADNKIEDPKVVGDILEAVEAYVKSATQMPQELVDKLKTVDELKSKAEIEVELAEFNKDFDKIVLPLIKAEYGDDIPAEKIAEIKESLKGIAYTPDYEKVSYDEIYLGKKDFRGVHTPTKRSAEGGRQSGVDLSKGSDTYTQELPDEEIAKLSSEEFEKYSNAMAALERNRK